MFAAAIVSRAAGADATPWAGADSKRIFRPMPPPGEGRNVVVMNTATKKFALAQLIPRKTDSLMGRMNQNSRSYIRAEEERLLTLNWHCVGQTPSAAT